MSSKIEQNGVSGFRIPPPNDPNKNQVLYHYCSTETFISIVRNRCIWLSDINTMNDFSEHHWAYERFVEAANLERDRLSRRFFDELDAVLSETQTNIIPFVSSFSTDGDVLSQWRAYADDGKGVSIGFDAKKIERLSVRSSQIEYDKEKQVAHFRAHLLELFEIYSRLPDAERPKFLVNEGAHMGVDFSCFKIPAFAEEREVRIIRALNVSASDGKKFIYDAGGTGEDKLSRKKLPVKFRSRAGQIVCYLEMPLGGLGDNFITEVIIGPKNDTSGPEINTLLHANGMKMATILKSEASYR